MNMPEVGGTKLKYFVLTTDFSDMRPPDFGCEYASSTLQPAHTPLETAMDSWRWNSSARQSMKKSRRVLYSTARPEQDQQRSFCAMRKTYRAANGPILRIPR